jgi:hypothetical protein
MKNESQVMQGHLNFALLAQEADKQFHQRFHRNTLRRWAIREGLYAIPETDPTSKAFHPFRDGRNRRPVSA